MKKATSILIAAVAALTLSGGAYAQAAGGSSGGGTSGSTASPTNQVNQANGTTSGYGTPGTSNSDSGMGAGAPNSGAYRPLSGHEWLGGHQRSQDQQHAGDPKLQVSPAANQ